MTQLSDNTMSAGALPARADRFTRQDTARCKGVACVLLLTTHLFRLESRLTGCTTVLDRIFGGTFGLDAVVYLGHVSRVCVYMFLILSGFGLTKSWMKRVQQTPGGLLPCAKFSLTHLLRLMGRYWFIFLLFVPFGPLFGCDPAVTFASSTPLKMWIKIAINFSGMSNLFFGSTLYTFNGTWWYMSVAILCYLLFPFLYALSERRAHLLLLPIPLCILGEFVPYLNNVSFYFIPFLIGMLAAKTDAFDIAVRWLDRRGWQGILASAAAVVIFGALRGKHNEFWDPLLALAVIALTVAVFSRTPTLGAHFELLGKHSANIFLFHTFLCVYYFAYIIYAPRYPLLILLLLLILCLMISGGIELCIRLLTRLWRRAVRLLPKGPAGAV